MILRLFLLFVRPLLEVGAVVFVFLGVGIGSSAMSPAVEATGQPILRLLFYGAYAVHFWLLFRESERSRLAFDVWLAAGLVAILLVTQFMWWEWPLANEPLAGADFFLNSGGEVNQVLLPYLHAAFWWAGRAGVGWLRRRYGFDA